MLLRVAALTLFHSFCEGRVNACIWRRSAFGIVHHGERRVACLGPVASDDVGVGGLGVYITQNKGRGTLAPISTLIACSLGRVSYSVTASFAAASAWSLSRMCVCVCVCALIFGRDVV
jgi:hypothetical protein